MRQAYRAQGFPPNTEKHWRVSACVGEGMGSDLLAHAAGELQTQLLSSLGITHRGPLRKALMQTLCVLTDPSVECGEVLSSAKMLQFSQRQPAPEATQAKRRSDGPLFTLELCDCAFLPILDQQSSWRPCGDAHAALLGPISFGELAEPASYT